MKASYALKNTVINFPFPDAMPILELFLVKHKGTGDEKVAMLVPDHGTLKKTAVYFNATETSTYSSKEYMECTYSFVRYLTKAESITITGSK